jgi:hypothetical protein
MKDRLNRKSIEFNDKMLETEISIINKSVKKLKKDYGYSEKQIKTEYRIKNNNELYVLDVAVFSKKDNDSLKIVGEIKKGNFLMPYAKYQLEQSIIATNAKYGFLFNGNEWINYQFVKGELILIEDIPTSDEPDENYNSKKLIKKTRSDYEVKFLLNESADRIWEGGITGSNAFLQLITFKLYDEVYENGKNFEEVKSNNIDSKQIIKNVWQKVNQDYPDLFNQNYFENITKSDLEKIMLLLSSIPLLKSNPTSILKLLLKKSNSLKKWHVVPPFELIEFIDNLLEITDENKIIIPYSNMTILTYFLAKKYHYLSKNNSKNSDITVIDALPDNNIFFNIISLLGLPKISIINQDPINTTIYSEIKNKKIIISIPPFNKKIIEKNEISEDYGNDEVNYFIKKLIASSDEGTKIAIVVPQSFLFNQSNNKIRNYILNNSMLKGIIQLPGNIMHPYTGIQFSLIILEISSSKKNNITFMSIMPKNDSINSKINEEVSNNICKKFQIFIKKSIVKNQTQNAFTVLEKDLIENSWTVADKVPEIKELQTIENKINLIDVVSVFRGISVNESSSDGKNIPFIRIGDLGNGLINSNTRKTVKIEKDILKKIERALAKEGDVLLSCRGTNGKTAIVESNHYGSLVSSQIMILRTTDKILPEYLIATLNSQLVQRQISGLLRGTAQQYFTINELEKIVISLPPLEKQHKIVSEFIKLKQEIAKLESTLIEKRVKFESLIKK